MFAAWAEVYDKQPNPLLTLEERYLMRLLPNIQAKDVLDLGCGTGRWLQHLAVRHPASLHGLDNSLEMLQIAKSKQLQDVQLVQAKLPALPIATNSVDIVLCSFVLSYIQELTQCASELARIMRDGSDLFLSDMHPVTAALLGWKRGFGHIKPSELSHHSFEDLQHVFFVNGFELVAYVTPTFGEVEHKLFQLCGKQAEWARTAEMPAIYLLQFRRVQHRIAGSADLRVNNAHCALGPNEITAASVSIKGDVFSSVVSDACLSHSGPAANSSIDLSGYLLLPGLINAHDHLEFALFPRLGSPLYGNATQWATDIQANETATIAMHKQVPKEVRLWWGGIRNLLCGATTVCHHNPLDSMLQGENYPVHVVGQYGWEHSLAFATDIFSALQHTDKDAPFLIHACEGIDEEAYEELNSLDALRAIERRSVLIHGLALDSTGIGLLNKRGASLIICPSSNHFLFGKTHTRDQLLCIERLALGSDSPLTASGDLLDELRFTKTACGLQADELYPLITDQAANVLRLRRGEGMLRPGSAANLIAMPHRPETPAETLAELSWRDVELVIVGGRVHLASANVIGRLPKNMRHDLTPLMVEGEMRWLRGPVNAMLRSAEDVLGKGNVRLGGLRISAAEA
jgi:cytosine/adenosine deaminase-related metal-dependent hydrolase/ubiquinone/menaquinone biosynthesis C-methylase UbiE